MLLPTLPDRRRQPRSAKPPPKSATPRRSSDHHHIIAAGESRASASTDCDSLCPAETANCHNWKSGVYMDRTADEGHTPLCARARGEVAAANPIGRAVKATAAPRPAIERDGWWILYLCRIL